MDPILITGCARSGTSMTAGIIYLSGVWGGTLSGPNRHNQKGMFENPMIRDLTKAFFRKIKVDPLGQNPLPNIAKIHEYAGDGRFVDSWKRFVTQVLRDQGWNGDLWFYKGAKMCLMWPIWHQAFPQATWIIVRRDTQAIIDSCMRTGFMRGYNTPSGWNDWVQEHLRRFEEMKKNRLRVYEVWPQEFIEGDFTSIRRVVDTLHLKWDITKVMEFVAPELWNGGE